jgi:alpha-beta hydrolase superfamily lysophospholipase
MVGEIQNQQGERIDFTWHHGRQGIEQVVVIGHGVTGNKDRPFVVALAEGLARAGVSALRFSFSGNGASGGKFTESTVSKEVEDLGAVIEALKGQKICYVGHSMGGAVGVLRAAKDSRIKALISLAGMVDTKAFAEREFGMVKPGGGFMWDDPNCPLSREYLEDMARIGSVLNEAPKIRAPWLLVHGTEDDVVPIQESQEIFARANEPKQLVELKGANHVFGGEHTAPMVAEVVKWVQARFSA